MRPSILQLLSVLALTLATAQASARTVAPAPMLPARELRAGETVEVRWGPLPQGVREFELLLSLDDGRTWPLRISAEMEPAERGLRWRVPDLATARARVRLRCGDELCEVEGEPSAPFVILSAGGPSRVPGVLRGGTWWNGGEAPRASGPRALSAPGFDDATSPAPACLRPRSGPGHAVATPAHTVVSRPLAVRESVAPGGRGRAPLTVPMRS